MRYLIVGNSAAGIFAAAEIRRLDPVGEIAIVSDEPGPAYSRCLISYVLSGDIPRKQLFIRGPDWYRDLGVRLIAPCRAERIDREGLTLMLDSGERLPFDRLLLATGSEGIRPPVEGIGALGITHFRTLKDLDRIRRRYSRIRRAVVVGGGFIGVKAATALAKRGIQVTLVEMLEALLAGMVDATASELAAERMRSEGIEVITGRKLAGVRTVGSRGLCRAAGVELNDGTGLDCDLVVLAAGVRPRGELAAEAGLEVRDGIVTDDEMRTSDAAIFAAGDAARTLDRLTGRPAVNPLWPNAARQGAVAGGNMAGASQRYAGSAAANSIQIGGWPIISFGIVDPPPDRGFRVASRGPAGGVLYRKVVLSEGRLVGMIMAGDVRRAGEYMAVALAKEDISGHEERLLVEPPDPPETYWKGVLNRREGYMRDPAGLWQDPGR